MKNRLINISSISNDHQPTVIELWCEFENGRCQARSIQIGRPAGEIAHNLMLLAKQILNDPNLVKQEIDKEKEKQANVILKEQCIIK